MVSSPASQRERTVEDAQTFSDPPLFTIPSVVNCERAQPQTTQPSSSRCRESRSQSEVSHEKPVAARPELLVRNGSLPSSLNKSSVPESNGHRSRRVIRRRRPRTTPAITRRRRRSVSFISSVYRQYRWAAADTGDDGQLGSQCQLSPSRYEASLIFLGRGNVAAGDLFQNTESSYQEAFPISQ